VICFRPSAATLSRLRITGRLFAELKPSLLYHPVFCISPSQSLMLLSHLVTVLLCPSERDSDHHSLSGMLCPCSITVLPSSASGLQKFYTRHLCYPGFTEKQGDSRDMPCVNKHFSCYLNLQRTRRMLVHACCFKTAATAADPRDECMGYPTPSGADMREGRDFLEMHLHCSQFVLLSKDLSCVKMHCLLFAKACCSCPLQTVQPVLDLLRTI